MIKLENCANSVQSAIEAQKGGAVRVELCDNLADGGTTPALSTIRLARKHLDIELNIIIRPRGSDFYYSELEFQSMKMDIEDCASVGVNGVVIGCLNKDGSVDMERNSELIKIAKKHNLSVTFHRAIDRSNDIMKAMEDIISLGCNRILSSGGKKTALEGKEILKKMIEQAGNRIIIMPGAGITAGNIKELINYTNLTEFHGTFMSRFDGEMDYRDENKILGNTEEEYMYKQTDKQKIQDAIINANK